jgi:predicted permease
MQAAMPSGLMGLLIAHVYGLDLRLTSAVIFWSTATVLVAALVGVTVGVG